MFNGKKGSDPQGVEVLMKVCKTLGCDIGDIMELIPTEKIPYKGVVAYANKKKERD